MGRITHASILIKKIKVDLVQCERKSWRLDEKLQSPRITKERRDELSRQRAELQSRILCLLNEINSLGKVGSAKAAPDTLMEGAVA